MTNEGDPKADAIHDNPDEEALVTKHIEDAERERIRRAKALATDEGDASHQGGAGAQGGQVDFGQPKNYAK